MVRKKWFRRYLKIIYTQLFIICLSITVKTRRTPHRRSSLFVASSISSGVRKSTSATKVPRRARCTFGNEAEEEDSGAEEVVATGKGDEVTEETARHFLFSGDPQAIGASLEYAGLFELLG